MSNSAFKEAINKQIPELLEMLGLERHAGLMRAIPKGRLGYGEAREIVHDALSWEKTLKRNGGEPAPPRQPTQHSYWAGRDTSVVNVILKDAVDPGVVSNHLNAGWQALRKVEAAFQQPYSSHRHLLEAAQWALKCASDVAAHSVAANQRAQRLDGQWRPVATPQLHAS